MNKVWNWEETPEYEGKNTCFKCLFIPVRNNFLIRVHFVAGNIKHSQGECMVQVVTQININAPIPKKLLMKQHLRSARNIGLNPAAQQREGGCDSLPLGPGWAKGRDHLPPPRATQGDASTHYHVSRKRVWVLVRAEMRHSCNVPHSSRKKKIQRTVVREGGKMENKFECTAQANCLTTSLLAFFSNIIFLVQLLKYSLKKLMANLGIKRTII